MVGTMSVSQTHLEAFHEAQRAEFSAASDCDMPSTPGKPGHLIDGRHFSEVLRQQRANPFRFVRPTDVVPIAVGISLILLVLVVLVAYLVGRRRAQARGYVSM